jgi:hypothetical protein
MRLRHAPIKGNQARMSRHHERGYIAPGTPSSLRDR